MRDMFYPFNLCSVYFEDDDDDDDDDDNDNDDDDDDDGCSMLDDR